MSLLFQEVQVKVSMNDAFHQIEHAFEMYALSKLISYSVDETYYFDCFVYCVKKKKNLVSLR